MKTYTYTITDDNREFWYDLIRNTCHFYSYVNLCNSEREHHKGLTKKYHEYETERVKHNALCHYIARLIRKMDGVHDPYHPAFEVAKSLEFNPYRVKEWVNSTETFTVESF